MTESNDYERGVKHGRSLVRDEQCPVCFHDHMAYINEEDCVSCGCGIYQPGEIEAIEKIVIKRTSEPLVDEIRSLVNALRYTVTAQTADGEWHWCWKSTGAHEGMCGGMLAIVKQANATIANYEESRGNKGDDKG